MIENLRKISSIFKTDLQPKDYGWLLHLHNPKGFSDSYSSLAIDDKQGMICLSSNGNEGGSYDVVYLHLDKSGNIIQAPVESEGVLPTVFLAPDKSIWTKITSTKMDGSKETILPIGDRSEISKLKTSREFTGDYKGTFENQAIFYDIDFFDPKNPDRLCKLIFNEKDQYQKRKILKLDMPRRNKVYLDSEGNLQLLAYRFEEKVFTHRKMDLDGNLLESRKLDLAAHHFGILGQLSLEEESNILITEDQSVYWVTISPEGEIDKQLIFEDKRGEYFYNIWGPKQLNAHYYAMNFNHDGGSGWAIFSKDGLKELFLDKEGGFENPKTKEFLDFKLPYPVIGETLGFEDSYALMIYTSSGNEHIQDNFYLIGRKLD